MARAALATVLVVLMTALLAAPAAASPGEDDVEHMQAKIRELIDHAAALEQAGRHEEARELLMKADQLGKKLHGMTHREGDRPVGVSRDEAKKLLGDLERGAAALKRLGRMEEAERVWEVCKALAARLKEVEQTDRRPSDERKPVTREAVQHRLEVLRIAMHGLMEIEKRDLAERIEQAIHAHELILEGAGPEHAGVKRAPRGGEMAEILGIAAKAWRQFHQPEKAERIEKLAREYGGTEKAREHGDEWERKTLQKHLEIMRSAMPALREGERREAVELLERAIHAGELRLSGRRDEEAVAIMKRAPGRGALTEILMLASKLWEKYGHETKASWCAELAGHYRDIANESRKHERDAHGDDAMRRLDVLAKQIAEMQRGMEKLLKEMEEIRREMR